MRQWKKILVALLGCTAALVVWAFALAPEIRRWGRRTVERPVVEWNWPRDAAQELVEALLRGDVREVQRVARKYEREGRLDVVTKEAVRRLRVMGRDDLLENCFSSEEKAEMGRRPLPLPEQRRPDVRRFAG